MSEEQRELLREEVLKEAIAAVMGDRNQNYGSPIQNFLDTAAMWNTYLADHLLKPIEPHDVAAMMVLLKVARLRVSPGKFDHWVDIAGYAACGGEVRP